MNFSKLMLAILFSFYNQAIFACVPSMSMDIPIDKFKKFISSINIEAINRHKSEHIIGYKAFGFRTPNHFSVSFSKNSKNEIRTLETEICTSNNEAWICESKTEMAAPITETNSYAILRGELSREKSQDIASFIIESANNQLKPKVAGEPIKIIHVNRELVISNLESGEYKITMVNPACFSFEIIVKEFSCQGNDCEFELLSNRENYRA